MRDLHAMPVLPPPARLHLHQGPIDLIIKAWGNQESIQAAYAAASTTFSPILQTLAAELPLLRTPLPATRPTGPVAHRMHQACLPFGAQFITPMAAVAGAVADHVLTAMTRAAPLDRAFVNNGGDIAFHLAPGQSLRCGLVTDLAAPTLDATALLHAASPARGIATSGRACKGRGGRSFSFGMADSVTVLARTAAEADAAATVIANAVDLPGHAAITRRPAAGIDPDSDLGARLVTWDVGPLTPAEIDAALAAGYRVAVDLLRRGLVEGAVLALRGRCAATPRMLLEAA